MNLFLKIPGGSALMFSAVCSVNAAVLPPLEQQQVARGEYLAHVADCVACHTAVNGRPFAGGLPINSPIGQIYSTNITPNETSGIGAWTYDDFALLLRRGQTRAGYTVYPAMPYPSYARINDADMHALFAYFQHGVQAVDQPNHENAIPWPLSIRWPLAVWRNMFAPAPAPYAHTGSSGPSVARGAYLVEGLGHCGSCHTTRGVAMQEQALTSDDNLIYVSGGAEIDGWIAPSLRNENGGGLGEWSEVEIEEFLRTGRNHRSASFGPMNDVIAQSTQFMTDQDRSSIAAYLKSLPARRTDAKPYVYDDHVAVELHAGRVTGAGAQIYLDRCAACHKSNGQGNGKAFPPLAGNAVLQTSDTTSAIHIVLSGSAMPATRTAPSALTMAPYAHVLNDQQIADVVSFIQTSWGNTGGVASASQVAKLRKTAVPVVAKTFSFGEPWAK
ncbi:cytochrome c [Caballeronia sp. dw_276]|jgi:mono/diheme cytochrome c family protein|uniref:cytochrome c n=1 Tax=Caballeronia sp. dw_276 TaxID=2719795 RepID=UPI001BD62491|nr:cytochrome c [Caballeronia sp. dw_276]